MTNKHNELFGEFDPDQHKEFTRKEYFEFVWDNDLLYKKSYVRKYVPNSKHGYTDSYTSELV